MAVNNVMSQQANVSIVQVGYMEKDASSLAIIADKVCVIGN
jgi:hypothetical protein